MSNLFDYKERESIAKELDINLLVEAGAGSGKTSSLVSRMLSIILAGKFKASEMAAITFTRKAAEELKERFQTELEKAYRRETDSVLKQRLEEALFDLEHCFLGTIHSFCARLLRERPVEAGLDPEFRELNEIQNRILLEKAWENYLLDVKLNRSYLLDRLNHLGILPRELKETFECLSNYPDVEKVYEKVPEPDFQPALERLTSLVKRARTAIPSHPPEKGYDGLQKAILRANRYLRYFDLRQKANIVKILSLFEKEPSVTQNRWIVAEEAKKYRDEFTELSREVIKPVLRAWREYCHFHLMEFLLPAVGYFEEMRRELSALNFQDLLMKTSSMLKNYPEVREYFQTKYRCLLIDEFQDTDPIQSEIMFYLTGTDTKEPDWLKLIPRPGSLFVVGDPKQSIYRFRRADIDTYNLVKDLISRSGGKVLRLTTNFRSLKSLGDWFNSAFRKIFPDKADRYQADFTSMGTVRNEEERRISGVKILDIPEEFKNKDQIVEEEAECIARYIRWALDGNVKLSRTPREQKEGVPDTPRPRDFMILLRYKDTMDIYARALERYGIPVSMAGGSSLEESLEIRELLKLLKLLRAPENQVYLVAVLRGLFFGISDNDLYKFKTAGGYFSFFSPVPETLDEETYEIFANAFNKLVEYYGWTHKYSPAVVLEKIIIDLGLVPYALTGKMKKSRCGYIYQVLEYLRRAEIDSAFSFGLLVEQFEAVLKGNLEEELNILEDEDSVRLMNIHKAKGLEAPVVFLANPAKNVSRDPEEHIRRMNNIPQGYFVFSRAKGKYHREVIAQPLDWEDCSSEEKKYRCAEEVRLLYVAATRARNMLVISRSLKDKDMKNNPWAPLLREAQDREVLEIAEVDYTDGYKGSGEISEGKPARKAGETSGKKPGEMPGEIPVKIPGQISEEEASIRILHDEETGDIITAKTMEKVREGFKTDIYALRVPGYAFVTPTGIKAEGTDIHIRRLTGGGMDWGSAVHWVFEELVRGSEDLDLVIGMALKENNLSPERKCELAKIVNDFKKSALWSRIEKAQSKYAEVPFSLKVDREHPLYGTVFRGSVQDNDTGNSSKGAQVPVILSGVIDLAFREEDGWVIVDYKSDRPQTEEDFRLLLQYYGKQIGIYCLVWEEITGQKVKAGEIYFTSLNETRMVYSA